MMTNSMKKIWRLFTFKRQKIMASINNCSKCLSKAKGCVDEQLSCLATDHELGVQGAEC